MAGQVFSQARISRIEVQNNGDVLYVFGDNMERRGLGGQAKAMRGERNAVGVPTKWSPTWAPSAYFNADSLGDHRIKAAIDEAFDRIPTHLQAGGDVVMPADGLGTGLAELPQRAPEVHVYIEQRLKALSPSSGPPIPTPWGERPL